MKEEEQWNETVLSEQHDVCSWAGEWFPFNDQLICSNVKAVFLMCNLHWNAWYLDNHFSMSLWSNIPEQKMILIMGYPVLWNCICILDFTPCMHSIASLFSIIQSLEIVGWQPEKHNSLQYSIICVCLNFNTNWLVPGTFTETVSL